MANIYLRKSTIEDLDSIMEIIEEARALLKKDGSPQWQDGSPDVATIKLDIEKQENWVLMVDDKIAGTTTLMTENDPNYKIIQDGSWNNDDTPYVTAHRVAISNKFRGMHLGKFLFSNLMTIAIEHGFKNFRIDTHEMNKRMQGLSVSLGFKKRGIIYVGPSEDDRRIAFELNL
ncbi:GNAT family N-acetyltransferase [Companilactobacillus mishanensis]|uniref:GNAT family N-acetyltransferase n=1 Tax=Companilactobacillus mishanensis TaxID=2486008 RepID=A0ABW9P7T0_9LACO|nr:GNAT family N-acetyltransferase [Companilactobacillus mishanensis]MQS45330.1 GNAT family N-acetyltransferase [Companilactobacillus mishanensis]